MTNLQTDPAVLKALRAAAEHEFKAEELRQQRISFVLGSLKEDSTVTRPQIERVLEGQAGRKRQQ